MKKEQQILARTAREADEQGNKSGTKKFKSLGKISKAGTKKLKAGTKKLKAGTKKLEAGTKKFKAGPKKLKAGTKNLEAGNRTNRLKPTRAPKQITAKNVNDQCFTVRFYKHVLNNFLHFILNSYYPKSKAWKKSNSKVNKISKVD